MVSVDDLEAAALLRVRAHDERFVLARVLDVTYEPGEVRSAHAVRIVRVRDELSQGDLSDFGVHGMVTSFNCGLRISDFGFETGAALLMRLMRTDSKGQGRVYFRDSFVVGGASPTLHGLAFMAW